MIKIKFKNTLIRDFNEADINKSFLNALNNKRLNKFISTRRKKQSYKDALKYLNNAKKNNCIHLIVINTLQKKMVGTITVRKLKKNSYFLGYMVCNIKYIGGSYFFTSVNKVIKYISNNLKGKKIYADIAIKNLPSGFFLRKLGFSIIEKNKKKFIILKKII